MFGETIHPPKQCIDFFFPVVPSGNNVRWFHWDSIIFVHLQICWSQTDRILPDVTCLIYLFWFNISFWAILAGWWFQILFIFIPIWGNDPIWLTCFKWVESTNQPGFPGFFFKKCVCLVHVASSSAIPPVPQGWCHVQGGWSQSGTLSLDAVGRLGDVFRMEKLPSYVGIFRDHEIWIPIKQPGFHGKVRLFFFFPGSCLLFLISVHDSDAPPRLRRVIHRETVHFQ